MATSSRKATGTAVFVLSMAVLVAGMGVEGNTGILLNVAAIAGCVVAIVLLAGGGRK